MNNSIYPEAGGPSDISSQPVRPARSFLLPILGVGVLALGGATIYQGTHTEELRQQIASVQKDNAALHTQLSSSTSDFSGELKALKDNFAQTADRTKSDVNSVRVAATRHADVLAGRLGKQQKEQNQQLAEQLGQVKESTVAASTRLDSISTEFGSARSDIDATRNDLVGAKTEISETRSDLQRVRGDMGMMSGLIATSSSEIQKLRDLGDRNIYEFTLTKSAGMQKVGDIQLALSKADPKHNRFTLNLLASDKLVQKRDKNVNEPVQFYTSKARQVYEIVVNEVNKDKVTGYLATPKVTFSRTESAPGR